MDFDRRPSSLNFLNEFDTEVLDIGGFSL